MVDFVKVWIRYCNAIKSNPLLDFRREVNMETGETKPYETAKYKGLKFKLWDSGLLELTGSLHKYKNNGAHNYDAFIYSMLCNVLHELEDLFQLDLRKCELHNIEFGVNIQPFMNTNVTLNNLLSHKNQKFDSGYKGNFMYAEHSQYTCKLYNKAHQYYLPHQNMRWELKFVKMEKLNKLGINSLSDLLKTNWINPIGELLISEWDNVLMYDNTIEKMGLDAITRDKKLLQWSNPNYWNGLTKTQKSRARDAYQGCVQQHSLRLQYQNGLRIENKWNELQNG